VSALSRPTRLLLRINPITCDGHGLCAELLPEVIALDDWGYPMPITAEVPPQLEAHAQRAAQACPTLAIMLERQRRRRVS
jgi:ferredoxin